MYDTRILFLSFVLVTGDPYTGKGELFLHGLFKRDAIPMYPLS